MRKRSLKQQRCDRSSCYNIRSQGYEEQLLPRTFRMASDGREAINRVFSPQGLLRPGQSYGFSDSVVLFKSPAQ